MRCPECHKFVSFGEPEASLIEEIVVEDPDGISVTVEVIQSCGECSTPLREIELREFFEIEGIDQEIDLNGSLEIEYDGATGRVLYSTRIHQVGESQEPRTFSISFDRSDWENLV